MRDKFWVHDSPVGLNGFDYPVRSYDLQTQWQKSTSSKIDIISIEKVQPKKKYINVTACTNSLT